LLGSRLARTTEPESREVRLREVERVPSLISHVPALKRVSVEEEKKKEEKKGESARRRRKEKERNARLDRRT
jgi:hypothetical protein